MSQALIFSLLPLINLRALRVSLKIPQYYFFFVKQVLLNIDPQKPSGPSEFLRNASGPSKLRLIHFSSVEQILSLRCPQGPQSF